MRIKHVTGEAASLIHEGSAYEPEEDGYFRLPFDLAQSLLRSPYWEAEPATVVVHEPEPELEEQDPAGGPETPGNSPENLEELTPAQKGALTKAANAAKAAAETDEK